MEYLQYYDTNVSYVGVLDEVLNLIINGIPSILSISLSQNVIMFVVLNLIINGIPSIQDRMVKVYLIIFIKVLNLIINGIPSILKLAHLLFRVYYTF